LEEKYREQAALGRDIRGKPWPGWAQKLYAKEWAAAQARLAEREAANEQRE
jgi:hypothetical protein